MSVSFSVLIPCYNCQKTIDRCLQSVLKQKYTNYKIYVVNDCSTDDTAQILNKYKQLGQIYYLQNNQENKSAVVARKDLIKAAKQDYILFLDSDDQFTDNAFQTYVNLIEQYNLDIVITDFYVNKLNQNVLQFSSSCNDDQIIVIKGAFDFSFKIYHYFLLWNKAIKRQVAQQIQVQDKYIYGCDDHMFAMQLYLNATTLGIFRTQPTYIYYHGAGQWGKEMDQLTMKRFCCGFKQTLIFNFQYILKNKLPKKYFKKCYDKYEPTYLKILANGNESLLKIYDQFFGNQFIVQLNKIIWSYK